MLELQLSTQYISQSNILSQNEVFRKYQMNAMKINGQYTVNLVIPFLFYLFCFFVEWLNNSGGGLMN